MMRLTLSSLSERFVLLRSLEQSKLGELSLATDQALSQPVLLLQLAATLTSDDDTLDALVADNLRLQASPDVLLTRAWFRTTEGTFLVTEAGSDGQLASELIRLRDKVEMPQLLAFAAALARAAASASRVQIAHLDLGPHRAWLEGGSLPGPVRVFGWGWSRLLPPYSNGAEAETFYGHPDYLAAELCKGLPASATADVYSAATAVWSLAAGKPPFLSAQPLMTVKRQSVEKPLRLDLVKPALKGVKDLHALLVEALDKDPAKRPGADAFLAAIAGAFATWAPELSPSSPAFPAGRGEAAPTDTTQRVAMTRSTEPASVPAVEPAAAAAPEPAPAPAPAPAPVSVSVSVSVSVPAPVAAAAEAAAALPQSDSLRSSELRFPAPAPAAEPAPAPAASTPADLPSAAPAAAKEADDKPGLNKKDRRDRATLPGIGIATADAQKPGLPERPAQPALEVPAALEPAKPAATSSKDPGNKTVLNALPASAVAGSSHKTTDIRGKGMEPKGSGKPQETKAEAKPAASKGGEPKVVVNLPSSTPSSKHREISKISEVHEAAFFEDPDAPPAALHERAPPVPTAAAPKVGKGVLGGVGAFLAAMVGLGVYQYQNYGDVPAPQPMPEEAAPEAPPAPEPAPAPVPEPPEVVVAVEPDVAAVAETDVAAAAGTDQAVGQATDADAVAGGSDQAAAVAPAPNPAEEAKALVLEAEALLGSDPAAALAKAQAAQSKNPGSAQAVRLVMEAQRAIALRDQAAKQDAAKQAAASAAETAAAEKQRLADEQAAKVAAEKAKQAQAAADKISAARAKEEAAAAAKLAAQQAKAEAAAAAKAKQQEAADRAAAGKNAAAKAAADKQAKADAAAAAKAKQADAAAAKAKQQEAAAKAAADKAAKAAAAKAKQQEAAAKAAADKAAKAAASARPPKVEPAKKPEPEKKPEPKKDEAKKEEGPTDAQKEASRMVSLAQKATTPKLKVLYLEKATRLDPTNAKYKSLLDQAKAELAKQPQ